MWASDDCWAPGDRRSALLPASWHAQLGAVPHSHHKRCVSVVSVYQDIQCGPVYPGTRPPRPAGRTLLCPPRQVKTQFKRKRLRRRRALCPPATPAAQANWRPSYAPQPPGRAPARSVPHERHRGPRRRVAPRRRAAAQQVAQVEAHAQGAAAQLQLEELLFQGLAKPVPRARIEGGVGRLRGAPPLNLSSRRRTIRSSDCAARRAPAHITSHHGTARHGTAQPSSLPPPPLRCLPSPLLAEDGQQL